MSTATMLIAALLLAGCDRPPPKVDAETLQQIKSEFPGMTPACLKRIKYGGIAAMPSEVQNCFRMTTAQRWSGLWRDDFEGQLFCPAPSHECSYAAEGDRIWISFAPGTRPRRGDGTGRTFLISFIGRRTLLPGAHGHLGLSSHEIVVDKLLSISPFDVSPSNR